MVGGASPAFNRAGRRNAAFRRRSDSADGDGDGDGDGDEDGDEDGDGDGDEDGDEDGDGDGDEAETPKMRPATWRPRRRVAERDDYFLGGCFLRYSAR
jgi:hypothetical protein